MKGLLHILILSAFTATASGLTLAVHHHDEHDRQEHRPCDKDCKLCHKLMAGFAFTLAKASCWKPELELRRASAPIEAACVVIDAQSSIHPRGPPRVA